MLKYDEIPVRELIGEGYDDFWEFKGRYRIVKGSRASKKSKNTAIWFIYNLMKYPEANLLVVRNTLCSLENSCFTELRWAINRLGVSEMWQTRRKNLELTYTPTGQKIFFRGMDDPMKIASIATETGVLCWMWIEEAYEIRRECDFDMVNESIRGRVPDGLFKQITMTFNPWSETHWIKKRFFDEVTGYGGDGAPVYSERENTVSDDGEILAKTVNYKCNEWLDESDLRNFEELRIRDPARYRIAGLGEWGVAEGLVYDNFEVRDFPLDELRKLPGMQAVFGLDFGYTNDPSALFCGLADKKNRVIYVFDELYSKGLTNVQLFSEIQNAGYIKEKIVADSSSPKDIAELRELGISRIRAAVKGPDSVNHGIQFAKNFKIVIKPKCKSFISEIANYRWLVDKDGKAKNTPEDNNNHLMDAMRYALEDLNHRKTFGWSSL